jgi:hypothetical protein
MSWVSVNRFVKREKNAQEVQEAVNKVAKHWRDVALDLGYDPDDNVNVVEGEKMFNIAISEELDATMREEHGDWW